ANRARSDAVPPYEFVISETPAMLARGITALAADPSRAVWNTRSLSSVELAAHYDPTDVAGSRPDSSSFVTAMDTTAAEGLDVEALRSAGQHPPGTSGDGGVGPVARGGDPP